MGIHQGTELNGSWCVCQHRLTSHSPKGHRGCQVSGCVCCRFRDFTAPEDAPKGDWEEPQILSSVPVIAKPVGRPRIHRSSGGERRRALLRKYGTWR